MKDKKSLYISSAVCSALSIVVASHVSAEGYYDPVKKRCYGAALAGQNDCPSEDPSLNESHSCKGTATTNCDPTDWKRAKSQKQCEKLIKKNCPENAITADEE